jgi:hypothetical protein
MNIYDDGNFLKSTLRTKKAPLIVKTCGSDQTSTQFKATVLLDKGNDHEEGMTANNWNKGCWELSSFEELIELSK